MTAYYNEIEPYAAAWLRNLIAEGLIAPGEVDERSIEDVRPSDLAGFTQCHFFAGIGVWSLALRRAGWPDDRPVWTGSCPCQPFSSAGKGGGFDDERHLWPAFHHLIRVCRPDVVLGEQVASRDGLAWIDLVHSDLEGSGYSVGAVDTCAAGFGAPHIRQRLYWCGHRAEGGVAYHYRDGQPGLPVAGVRRSAVHDAHGRGAAGGMGNTPGERQGPLGGIQEGPGAEPAGGSEARRVADAEHSAEHGNPGAVHRPQVPHASDRWGGHRPVGTGETGGVAYTANLAGPQEPARNDALDEQRPENGWRSIVATGPRADGGNIHGDHSAGRGEIRPAPDMAGVGRPGPTNGLWRDADWIYCRDGRWRPVESLSQSMVDGTAVDLGRVRAGQIRDIELEIAEWAVRHEADPGKALRYLRSSLSAQEERERTPGRLPDLHGAAFLLAFLRQLTEQGWAFSERTPSTGEEISEAQLRVLRHLGALARASRERGLDGQSSGECADSMRVLSSILARHAQEAWGRAYDAYATIGFPLTNAARGRIGRLRAYGNAITLGQAQAFVEAVDYARRVRLTGGSDFTGDVFS